jgi:hypothetical protein
MTVSSSSSSRDLSEELPPARPLASPGVVRRGTRVVGRGRAGEAMGYSVAGEVGAGSFATVLACESDAGERVAVKLVHKNVA